MDTQKEEREQKRLQKLAARRARAKASNGWYELELSEYTPARSPVESVESFESFVDSAQS